MENREDLGDVELDEVAPENELSWGDRLLATKRQLSPRHRKLAELAAQGLRNGEIAKLLDYTDSRVSILLSNTKIRDEIDKIRERSFQESIAKRLKDLGDTAIGVVEECLTDDSNKYKEANKIETAKWLIEKLDGKPVQKHDVGENILGVMMDRIDALKSSGQTSISTIEVTALPEKTATSIENGEIPVQNTPKSEEEMLSDWVIAFKPTKNN